MPPVGVTPANRRSRCTHRWPGCRGASPDRLPTYPDPEPAKRPFAIVSVVERRDRASDRGSLHGRKVQRV
jgi:hypothetical protein